MIKGLTQKHTLRNTKEVREFLEQNGYSAFTSSTADQNHWKYLSVDLSGDYSGRKHNAEGQVLLTFDELIIFNGGKASFFANAKRASALRE